MTTAKGKKKTEAAKVLLAAGWDLEDVFEVLQLDEPTVVAERVVIKERDLWRYRPVPYLQNLPKINMKAITDGLKLELNASDRTNAEDPRFKRVARQLLQKALN
jgi:hypothetical protein